MRSAVDIAKTIRGLALANQVSVNKTLSDCGLGKSLIVDMERIGCFPTADKLNKLADYFNVSTDYLLGRTDNPEVNQQTKGAAVMKPMIVVCDAKSPGFDYSRLYDAIADFRLSRQLSASTWIIKSDDEPGTVMAKLMLFVARGEIVFVSELSPKTAFWANVQWDNLEIKAVLAD